LFIFFGFSSPFLEGRNFFWRRHSRFRFAFSRHLLLASLDFTQRLVTGFLGLSGFARFQFEQFAGFAKGSIGFGSLASGGRHHIGNLIDRIIRIESQLPACLHHPVNEGRSNVWRHERNNAAC